MNDTDTKTTTPETPEQELARLREERIKRETARATANTTKRAIEKEKLFAKFEAELGERGSEWDLFDTGFAADPFVVVTRPAMVQWTKYDQSKMTPTDRYDLVTPSVVHPSREAFNELRQRRVGIDVSLVNIMAPMMGLAVAADAGK